VCEFALQMGAVGEYEDARTADRILRELKGGGDLGRGRLGMPGERIDSLAHAQKRLLRRRDIAPLGGFGQSMKFPFKTGNGHQ
jgi:hypothetical protein